jgi:hypothetical protein
VSDYVLARLEAAKGCEIEFGDTYADYTAWCGTRRTAPLSPELFAEAMKRLCEKARVRVRRKAGSAVFIGLRLVGVGSTATTMATNRTFSAAQHFLPPSEDERKRPGLIGLLFLTPGEPLIAPKGCGAAFAPCRMPGA